MNRNLELIQFEMKHKKVRNDDKTVSLVYAEHSSEGSQ